MAKKKLVTEFTALLTGAIAPFTTLWGPLFMLVFREVEVLARNQIETPESDVFTQEMSPQVFRSL